MHAQTNVPKPAAKHAEKTKTPMKVAAKTVAPKLPERTSMQEDDEEGQKDVWYWNLVTQEGKIITKKVTTEQIRMLIKAGHIEPDAEVARTMKGDYRPVATYKEFQAHFKARETATKVNTKGKTVKSQMQELAAEHERRQKYGWMSRMFKSAGGTVIGLLWIVLILALVAVGGYFGWVYLSAM